MTSLLANLRVFIVKKDIYVKVVKELDSTALSVRLVAAQAQQRCYQPLVVLSASPSRMLFYIIVNPILQQDPAEVHAYLDDTQLYLFCHLTLTHTLVK